MSTSKQVSERVVAISTQGFPHGQGLGVLCDQWIFTCAHYLNALNTKIGDADFLEVWRISDETKGTFAVLYASTMDFMILAPDGMTLSSSEAGGTETSWDLIHAGEETGPPLRPAEVVIQSGITSTKVPGYFFGPDGKTVHRVEFAISKNSGLITFFSNDGVNGCSGGPLFTDDHQLVGIYTSSSNYPMEGDLRHCIGRRIDLCIPRLLYPFIEWNSLMI